MKNEALEILAQRVSSKQKSFAAQLNQNYNIETTRIFFAEKKEMTKKAENDNQTEYELETDFIQAEKELKELVR